MGKYIYDHAWARRTYIVVSVVPFTIWHILTEVIPEVCAEVRTHW